jgi:nicotinate-nucleotide adenylyltransferase
MLIGLFGGTFDPPHLGHLALCREAVSDLHVEQLFWVLTPNPPHKTHRQITSLPHRLRMVQLALQDTSYELSRVDIDRPAPHYAVDTVRIVREQNPRAQLLYLMGGDSLNNLPTWHRAVEFVAALDFIGVMHREGEIPDLQALEMRLPGLASKVRFVEAPRVDISASQVRLLIKRGKPYEHLLPSAVARYIKKNNLYQTPKSIPELI